MKKKDMDLLVGGSILVAVIILITGVLWLKEVSLSRKLVDYAVLFPNVGTLQVGDPVMINGVSNGAVKKISLRGEEVAVLLEVDKKIRITDSCRIMIQNIGLMGERGVGIQYVTTGNVVKPLTPTDTDTLYLTGSFDTGIAEAMGMLGSVLGEVQELTGNVAAVVDQTVGDTAFITLFKTLLVRLDSISYVAGVMLDESRVPVENSIKNLEAVTEEARRLVNRNGPVLDTIADRGKMLADRAVDIVGNIDTLTAAVQNILDKVQDEKTTAGKLLSDGQLYDEVTRTVADLDSLIRAVQEDALKLRIKIGFGKKRK